MQQSVAVHVIWPSRVPHTGSEKCGSDFVQQVRRYRILQNGRCRVPGANRSYTEYGFGVRRAVFYPLLGDGIFTQEGPAWKHSRDLLRKQFARIQYQDLYHFSDHVDNLLRCLPSLRGVVDLQPLFFNLTLDTTTALLVGRSVHSLKTEAHDDIRAFQEGFNAAQEGLAKRFRIAPWQFFYNPSKFRNACSTVHRFVDDYIQELDSKSEKGDPEQYNFGFIDQLARDSQDTKSLRDHLLNILLAGRDSTACSLSWTLYV